MRWSFVCIYIFLSIQFTNGQEQTILLVKDSISAGQKKLSPDLLDQYIQQKIGKHQSIDLLLAVKNLDEFKRVYQHHDALQLLREYTTSGSLQIKANGDWLKKAMADKNIAFIANARKPFTERELTGFDLSLNKVSAAHAVWPTINGDGITVSIKEQLLDTNDIDFKGRYLAAPMASNNLQTHATTMATIVAGAGNTFYTGKGVAWGAQISNADFSNLLPDNLAVLNQLKVGVQNHSYGVGIENYYGADAQAYDVQVNQDTNLVHVFSAGNMGNLASSNGIYAGITGYANLTGSFKMAKNSLAIGATDLFNQTIAISSRGPAYDGRVKPELVALGEDGSSGAAALVSGVSLLLKDVWAKNNPLNHSASAALIKAVLLNSADDIGSPYIDFISGYGSLNAKKAVQTIAEKKIIQGRISQNQVAVHRIVVPSNTKEIKLTISWIDPPATANSPIALLNDLDLELVNETTGESFLPWVLNHQPSLLSLSSPAVRGRDSMNNTEQISVQLPADGPYQIRVRGSRLSTQTQAYSIAWQIDSINHFQFTFPVKGNSLISKSPNIIRWESNAVGTGSLQVQLNGGSWETISNQVDLAKQYYHWDCPDQIGYTQFRMIGNAVNMVSDTITMSPIVSLQTGFNCTDSFLLSWPPINVANYQLFKLGNKYLEPDIITADTLIIKSKLNNPSEVYSVAPIVYRGFNNFRGYAQNYTQQQLDCYIKGFVADPSGLSNAQLRLEIGTNYLVQKVEFEKRTTNGYQSIQTISPINNRQITSIVTASNGLNIYRAKLSLVNGKTYYSTPSQVLIFGEQSYYLFPNPVVNGSQLKLMSAIIDSTIIMIFDLSGRKVHQQIISSFIETIALPLLPKGTYYAIINRNGIIQKRIPFIIL